MSLETRTDNITTTERSTFYKLYREIWQLKFRMPPVALAPPVLELSLAGDATVGCQRSRKRDRPH